MKKTSVTRRTLLTGTFVLGAGMLTACTEESESAEYRGSGVGAEAQHATSTNPQERTNLQTGGSLNLACPALGPNFNISTEAGYSIPMLSIHAAVNSAAATGGWKSDTAGNLTLNPDYVTDFKTDTADGVQRITLTLNPRARFNDGTPIDLEALRTAWHILRGSSDGKNDYAINDSGAWRHIASIEKGRDQFTAIITMKTPWYPLEGALATFIHPALKDPELFNTGFIDQPLDQYWAGPYKVKEWDPTEKILTVERNESWWGSAPLLETITWRQIDDEALERAAFKNGELDAVSVGTVSAYNDVAATKGIEIRRGTALYAGVLKLNPSRVPLPLRQALAASVDRKQIQRIRFGQLGWKETPPGSFCFLPLQSEYRNNYPRRTSLEDASKILENAGYTRRGTYQKGDEKASVRITNFTADPVAEASSNFLLEQFKRLGIDTSMTTRPAAEYSSALAAGDYDAVFTGYSMTPTPAEAAAYLYASAQEGWSTEELRRTAERMLATEDERQRLELIHEIEKKHLHEVCTYIPLYNGPDYLAVRTKLANYGPALFQTPYYDPNVWINVGWENETV